MVREEVNEIVINVSATEIKDSSDVTMLGHMVEEGKNNSDVTMLVHMVEGSRNNSDEDKAVERNPEEERREEEEYLVEDVKPNIKEENGVCGVFKQEMSSEDEEDYKALLRAKEEVERLEQKLGAKSGGGFKREVVKTELEIGEMLEVEILEVKVMEVKAKTEEKKKEEEECDEDEVLICFLYFIFIYLILSCCR